MVKYIIKRILLIPITLLIISALVFFLVNMNDVDATSLILPSSASQEDRDNLREELGLDDPIIIQYFNYIKGVFQGDLGDSWANNASVTSILAPKIGVTAKLAIYSTLLAMIVGIPLGILCAVKQYSVVDRVVNALSMCIGSMPNFFSALVLMLIFSVKLGWTPIFGVDSWTGWILPTVTLGTQASCSFVRVTRSCMLDCIRQDYVNTARSMGHKERTVILKHTMKNAILPLITLVGQNFAIMMGGAVVAETVFAIPGLGLCIVNAINTKDIPLIIGATLFISCIFLICSVLIDITYAFADPRVRSTFISVKKNKKKANLNEA